MLQLVAQAMRRKLRLKLMQLIVTNQRRNVVGVFDSKTRKSSLDRARVMLRGGAAGETGTEEREKEQT